MSERQARLVPLVAALGVGQIVSWGTLYFSIAVLAQPIQRDLGFGETQVFGAFTVALLVSGIAAPFVGRLIDTRGGAGTMALGSALGAAAFATIGAAEGFASFLLGWCLAGLAMAAGLYEAGIATLSRSVPPERYRRAVTALTLYGGFASTVFWPLTHVLVDGLGWREACFIYAALHLVVGVPLHRWMVGRAVHLGAPPSAPGAAPQGARYTALSAAFAANAFVFPVLSVYLVQILAARGLSQGQAIWLASLVGVFQVAARVAEYALATHMRAVRVGTVAFGMLLAGLLVLLPVSGPSALAFCFVALYGASNGIMTIVRGTVPAALYGHGGYGALLGRLARPSFVARALAPAAFSSLAVLGLGFDHGLLVLALCAALGWAAYEFAARRV